LLSPRQLLDSLSIRCTPAPLPEAAADEVGVSQQRLAKLDEFFAREIASKRVPGAVIAIARDGKLIHYKAYGQLDPVKGSSMRSSRLLL